MTRTDLTRPLRRRFSTRGEAGSALPMAMVFMTFVGLLTVSALSYAGTSLRSSNVAYRPARTNVSDADGAIQTAIQYVRNDQASGGTVGQDLGTSPCGSNSLTYPGTSGPVSVDICPQLDSFIHDGGFRSVLLTLAGQNGQDAHGEGIALSMNNDARVYGNVFSNSTVSANPASLTVSGGRLWAWGPNGCSGNITADGGKDCNAQTTFAGTVPKVGQDPGTLDHPGDWKPAAGTTVAQTPSCTPAPGVYLHGDDLSALNCPANRITLARGVYFLAFPPDGSALSKSSTDDVWRVNADVVGAPCGADGQGTQIVFANAAQVQLTGGSITLPCGRQATATGPMIGMTALVDPIGAGAPVSTVLRPVSATDTGATKYFGVASLPKATPAGSVAYPLDTPATNAVATVVSSGKVPQLTLGGFAATSGPALTQNANVSSVVVKVAHSESRTNVDFTTTPPQLVWGSCSVNLTPSVTASATTALYTSTNLASSLAACPTFDPSVAPSVVWPVRTTSNGSVDVAVDGAQVETTWNDRGIPAQTGCVLAWMNQGGCPVIDGFPNGHTQFEVDGVVYLPKNQLRGVFKNTGSFKVTMALIARSVDLNVNPASDGQPIIGSSSNQFTAGNVLFTARIGGNAWIEARATFDGTASAPAIKTWVVKR